MHLVTGETYMLNECDFKKIYSIFVLSLYFVISFLNHLLFLGLFETLSIKLQHIH